MSQADIDVFTKLLQAQHPGVAILTFEEEYAVDVVRQAAMGRGQDLWVWSHTSGLRDGLVVDGEGVEGSDNPAAAIYSLIKDKGRRGVFLFLDLATHLEEKRCLRLLRELLSQCADIPNRTVVLVDQQSKLPPVIENYVARMDLTYPSEPEVDEIIKQTLKEVHRQSPIELSIRKEHFAAIVRNMGGLTRRQVRQVAIELVSDDRKLNSDDVTRVIQSKRTILSSTGLLDFVEAPLSMDEIGGLNRLKEWLSVRANSFSEEAKEYGLATPRGVLLLGVQGAGKSLAAKAVATAWQRPLLRMDVGAFYDKFVGESERRLRDAFKQAEMMAPIVLWIDEIEKAFASASANSADGGLSKRMFGALLTWMQEHESAVFLIATANDIAALPPELMRKGRFDEIFFVDLPTPDARKQIFSIHLSRRKQVVKDFDLNKLAQASDGFSGAEIEQAVLAALHEGFAKQTPVTTEMVVEAIKATNPLSVTMREKVNELRRWASDRCVGAD
jgi:ATP-dependent 26S proteasome regulatory subunit